MFEADTPRAKQALVGGEQVAPRCVVQENGIGIIHDELDRAERVVASGRLGEAKIR